MYKGTFTHHLARILVDILFYAGIVCLATMYWWLGPITRFLGIKIIYMTRFTLVLLASGAASLYIVWQLKKMFRTLIGGNPFVEENITCLRKCAVASFCVSITYIFWLTIASSIIIIIFGILGLFCLTLKDLFKQAIQYKQENDWTV